MGTPTLLAALCALSQACGSSKPGPTAPTVVSTPAPTPTPTPRQTISLDASADHYRFSVSPMAQLTSPQAFDLTITPRGVNEPYPSDFSHTVEVWFWTSTTTNETYTASAICFSMVWAGDSHWTISSFSPEGEWYDARSGFDLPLGQTMAVRFVKHAEGLTELFVNGASLHTIEDKEATRLVRARVVGMAADFSYIPVGLTGSGLLNLFGSPRPCVDCAPRR